MSDIRHSSIGNAASSNIFTSNRTIYVDPAGSDATGKGTASSPYASISHALSVLEDKLIAPEVVVTIQLADGTYNISEEITIRHPNGNRIQIIGNAANEALVVLNFNNDTSGITCFAGTRLGLLNGVTIKGTWLGSGSAGLSQSGIRASGNSYIACGDAVTVDDFYYGVQADRGGHVECDSIVVTDAGDVGIFAYNSGVIQALNATVSNCRDTTRSLGSGVATEIGGSVWINNINVTTCDVAGINCIGGDVRCDTFTAESNDGEGVRADRNGQVECSGTCSASNNTSHGIRAMNGGRFAAFGTVNSDSNGGDGLSLLRGHATFEAASTFDGNTGNGILAHHGSTVTCATGSSASSNGGNGIDAFGNAFVAFNSSTVNNNTGTGITAVLCSSLFADSVSLVGNTGGATNITADTLSSDGSFIRTV